MYLHSSGGMAPAGHEPAAGRMVQLASGCSHCCLPPSPQDIVASAHCMPHAGAPLRRQPGYEPAGGGLGQPRLRPPAQRPGRCEYSQHSCTCTLLSHTPCSSQWEPEHHSPVAIRKSCAPVSAEALVQAGCARGSASACTRASAVSSACASTRWAPALHHKSIPCHSCGAP